MLFIQELEYNKTQRRAGKGTIKKMKKKKKKQEMSRKKVFLLTALFLGLSVGAAAPAYAGDTFYITGTAVRGRSTAEIREDNIVTHFSYGEKLTKLDTQGDWTKVQAGTTACYVATRYLSAQNPVSTVQKNTANLTASKNQTTTEKTAEPTAISEYEPVSLSADWQYAGNSKINSGQARLYRSMAVNRKNKTICVNAGHGTSGGSSVKTLCHPDGSAKVTGGSTGAGAVTATAVSAGMTFLDGTPEAKVTLQMALILKERLLKEGYDVLMIRESDDVQLDNIARTVLANNKADCHIALHWDSSTSDKGVFYMSVPSNQTYRAMEPVASNWQSHNRLGEALIAGLKSQGAKLFSSGSMEMDLTQTSYSTVPSIDIELGDKASDHSEASLSKLADGLVAGVNSFFGS